MPAYTFSRVPCHRRPNASLRLLTAGCLALALALGGCGSAAPRFPAARSGPPPPRPVRAPAPPGGRLAVRRLGRLPAPVQLPAVAAMGSGVVSAGGLDAQDASVADIVRVAAGPPFRARRIGALPAPLHDAAAATAAG